MKPYSYHDYEDFQFRKYSLQPQNGFSLRLDATHPAHSQKMWVPYYHFKIIVRRAVAGHIDFRAGNTGHVLGHDGHIGYGVLPAFRGKRLSQRACEAILPFVAEHGFQSVLLTCRPNNLASIKIIEGLGARYVDTSYLPGWPSPAERERFRYRLLVPGP